MEGGVSVGGNQGQGRWGKRLVTPGNVAAPGTPVHGHRPARGDLASSV
jgi:hypothetical protein